MKVNPKRICVYLPDETLTLLDGVKKLSNLSRGTIIEKSLEELTSNKSLVELQKLGELHE